MKILVTGTGRSGSWQIRGEQLGRAIDAAVNPNYNTVKKFDAMILVKRPAGDALRSARTAKVPVIYDIVDAWQQTVGPETTRKPCIEWLQRQYVLVRPAAWVAATEKMAADCKEVAPDIPVLALPHHARPGIVRNPIREEVKKVGYEGSEKYLGPWRELLTNECARRGWEFVINPTHVADVDILVAVRNETGYAPRSWKSNVKLANAQGSGTPCVMNYEAGYQENASGAECWADTEKQMCDAFNYLTPYETRLRVSQQLYTATPWLETIAQAYREWLSTLKF